MHVEQKMLDHMKTYLLETKVAESNLNEQERKIWDEMKQSFAEKRNGPAPAVPAAPDGPAAASVDVSSAEDAPDI